MSSESRTVVQGLVLIENLKSLKKIIYIMLIFDLDNNVPVLDNLTLAEFLTYYGQFDPTSG